MFEAFNIIDATEYSQQELDNLARGNVSLRRKYISSIKQLCLKQLADASKQAYLRKLEILKKSGKVGEETLKVFQERLVKNPIIASQNDYKALNELLDSAIETHKESIEKLLPEIKETGNQFAEQVTQIEQFANINLKNLQKSYAAAATITSQQAIVNKNIQSPNQVVKKIVTKEAENLLNTNNNIEIETPKQEKDSVFKTILGGLFRTNQETTKDKKQLQKDKKETLKEKDSNKQENKTEKSKPEQQETKENKPNNIQKQKDSLVKESQPKNNEKTENKPVKEAQENKKTDNKEAQHKKQEDNNKPENKEVSEKTSNAYTASYHEVNKQSNSKKEETKQGIVKKFPTVSIVWFLPGNVK